MSAEHAAAVDLVLTNAVDEARALIRRRLNSTARSVLSDALRVAARLEEAARVR